MSHYYKKCLTTEELLDILENDVNLQIADNIDAVYIPPSVDELTDEEVIDDDIIMLEEDIADIVGTYEIHRSTEQQTAYEGQEPGSSTAKEISEQETIFDEQEPGPSTAKKIRQQTRTNKDSKNKGRPPKMEKSGACLHGRSQGGGFGGSNPPPK